MSPNEYNGVDTPEFLAMKAERNRYRKALEKIIDFSDSEMGDGDGAREVAEEALKDA